MVTYYVKHFIRTYWSMTGRLFHSLIKGPTWSVKVQMMESAGNLSLIKLRTRDSNKLAHYCVSVWNSPDTLQWWNKGASGIVSWGWSQQWNVQPWHHWHKSGGIPSAAQVLACEQALYLGLTWDLFWARAASSGGRIGAGLKSGELARPRPNPLAAARAQNKSPKINLAWDPNGELARRLHRYTCT